MAVQRDPAKAAADAAAATQSDNPGRERHVTSAHGDLYDANGLPK
ncbi:hypothetical protein J2Y48_004064 [Mycoplana sp. BE70]|nr:hypothetical protein [Mycoplana sp. BE70]MDR6758756.1 hypothetical protein [Mycoplana sp. BE70]